LSSLSMMKVKSVSIRVMRYSIHGYLHDQTSL
jgi:hypothetical protein